MRFLDKLPIPNILELNENKWLEEYKDDRSNNTRKFRYRHADIKAALKEETSYKCVYCESKIGHNTPGDIEHKVPSSKNEDLRFSWENLTIACTECNRRKNDYFEIGAEFLDPYVDDVEELIEHHGPIVFWKTGNERAEISIRILELNSNNRLPIIISKIEKIEEVSNLCERYNSQNSPVLKELLKKQLLKMADNDSEYSGMVMDILEKKGLTKA